MSTLGIAVFVFLVSLSRHDATASSAFIVTMIAIGGWLSLFALAHLFRSPWLIHSDEAIRIEANEHHEGWGIFGIAAIVLMIAGAIGSGLWFYTTHRVQIVINSPPVTTYQEMDRIEEDRLEQKRKELGIEEQHQNDRKRIEAWIARGNELKEACISLQDSPNIEQRVYGWRTEITKMIRTVGDGSRSISSSASPDPAFSGTLSGKPISPLNNKMWNIANDITGQLEHILGQMP